jgi:prolipoprotein diacylglyceryl transferase
VIVGRLTVPGTRGAPRYRGRVSSAVATAVLAAFPSPDRGIWHLGPVPIRAYALCIIAGIVVAVLWGERRFVARGGAPGTVTDVAVWAVPFGLVGGRLYHVATDWQTYFGPGGNPVDAFKIWQGGLGIWGAVALGAVGAWIGCRRRGVPLPFFADAVAPGIVTAQAIGRLGNWFNQELYGAPTTLPWGLEIYRRVDPATGAPDTLGGVAVDHTPLEVVHPTFLYELLWNLAVAALVVWADRRFRLGHGRAFAVYVAGYTAGRFWIEQMRTDYATRVFGDLRINVVVAAVVFLAAVAYIVLVRAPREVLATAPADGADKLVLPDGSPAESVAAGDAAPARSATGATGLTGPIPPPAADPPRADGSAAEDTGGAEPEAGEPVPGAAAPEAGPTQAEGAETEGPETEGPETEGPEAGRPEAETPEAEAPEAEAPGAEGSDSGESKADRPEADRPEADGSEADGSEADVPEAARSEVGQPAVDERAAQARAADQPVADEPAADGAEPAAGEPTGRRP